MLDLVFAIAADPLSLPLWAVVLFAAGMYPIGFMLGAECSPCCGVCGCAPNDPLPETVTVTFNGFTDQTPGPDLISLSFSSCYGSGAEARVTAPGGDPDTDKGPISEVLLTKAGSGYAKLGRVQPTVTLGGGSGTGATFSVTLSQEQDACKIDYWKVSAISVTGGTGFADGEALTFTVAEGDTEEQAASATVQTTRAAPTLTASVSPGSGASLAVTVVENEYASPATWYVSEVTLSGGGTGYVDGSQVTFTLGSGDIAEYNAWAVIQTNRLEPAITASIATGTGAELDVTLSQTTDWDGRAIWTVASVDVTDGGTGYVDGSPVSFTPGSGDTEAYGASATIQTNRLEPTLSAQASIQNGSGAELDVTLSQTTDYEGRAVWIVSGITVTNGGSGYVEGDGVFIDLTDGSSTPYSYFEAVVASVDETGAITGITVNYPGEYYKDGGVIQSVQLFDGGWYFKDGGVIQSVQVWGSGSYYNDDGVPTGVTLAGGGVYYREDATATPYVADVTVSVSNQNQPSDGTGATFTVTVEDDTSSEDFGKIVALEVDDGGDGYLAWRWVANACCGWQLNGMPIVLKRGGRFGNEPCQYWHRICGGWRGVSLNSPPYFAYSDGTMGIVVDYNGSAVPPTVRIVRHTISSSDYQPDPACAITLTSETTVENCSDLAFSTLPVGGVTATVTTGGDYDANFKGKHGSADVSYSRCTLCCQGADDVPTEIEVYVEHNRYGATELSGTYVLSAYGTYNQPWTIGWGWSQCLDEWCASRFNIGIGISPGMCGASDPQDCDNCVKKCEISAACNIANRPAVWWDPDDDDMRKCVNWDLTITDSERAALLCQSHCFDVPLCAPPQGMEFSFYDPNGSENFGANGCPNCCAENTNPEYPNHLNTFKMTVQ